MNNYMPTNQVIYDKFLENIQPTKTEPKRNRKPEQIIKNTETVIKNHLTKKSLGPHVIMGDFYLTFEELIPIILKYFQKIEEKEMLLNSFYEVSNSLISKGRESRHKKTTGH